MKIKGIKIFFVNHFIKFLPNTHFYKLKVLLYNWCGFNISYSAQIYSSINIFGDISLNVGNKTFIGHEVLIVGGAKSKIQIGSEVDIAPRVLIETGSHKIDMENLRSAGEGESLDIIIDNGVWVGANTTILGGVHIGTKSIIAAGSVVISDIPPYTIAAGVPCRPIKKWDNETKKWIRL